MWLISILCFVFCINAIVCLIGYDCGSSNLNVTTLSLRDVGDCETTEKPVNVTPTYIQLLQVNDYTETQVYQCKIEIHRTVYYCGMHSHVSIVLGGENEYVLDIGKRACTILHTNGIVQVGNSKILDGIRVNDTTTRGIIFAGYVNNDGKCNGEGYSDPYGSWESAVVQGTVKITLTQQIARVKLSNNNIHLRSGTVCPLSAGSCIDSEDGHSFWDTIPTDLCNFQKYGVLYEGLANKMTDPEHSEGETVYSLSTQDVTFALTAKGRQSVCGYIIIKTEHPKLLVFETSKGEGFASKSTTSVANLDIFAYVNSKFVYVEKHLRTQMKSLYADIIYQKCNLERQTLRNSLSLATQAPDGFAYDLMKGPGYMAVLAGEVVHVIKCIPVEVKLEHGENCYAELQVKRNNDTQFLTPRTHILKTQGTRMPCNAFLPAYYLIGDSWYKILPRPTETLAPMTIKPLTRTTWKYTSPAALATSGIYTEKDLEQLRERIMFPVERPALLNDLARELRGHPIGANEGSLLKLLNEDAVDKIVTSTWDKVWSKFLLFGHASAGIIGVLMIIHIIKMVIDIAIQGYALHSIYGWSIHLLGAIWSSITHFLVYIYKPDPEKPPQQDENVISSTATAPIEEAKHNNETSIVPTNAHFPREVSTGDTEHEEKGESRTYPPLDPFFKLKT